MTPEEKRTLFFKNNPDISLAYKEILNINSSSENEFTEQKLREIKQYAISHSDYYSNYDGDDEFPVMNKMDYINNYELIKSKEVFTEPLHISSTSGSTGVPFKVEQDRIKRNRTIADLKAFGKYANFESHEKMIQLRSYCGTELDRTIDERENIWRYDILDLWGGKIDQFIDFTLRYNPVVIFSYVNALEAICDYIISTGKEYDFKVKSILVGAEALTEQAYYKFNKVFKCPVFDRYSNMEMGILAQREYGKPFKINKASYYFECLKLNSNEKAAEGEIGRLVFTDLFNHALPMIRYDTGDLGTYKIIDGEVYIDTIYGRAGDQIIGSNGEIIDLHNFTRIMRGIEGVRQWQLIQKDINKYQVIISAFPQGFNKQEIINRMKAILGENANVSVVVVDEIPVLNSQKRKLIVNEIKDKL